jgi:hypothetical protein
MTEADYRAALAEIDALMAAETGTPEGKRLDHLVDRVEAHESRMLGGWDYRLIRYSDGCLGLHEVYYRNGAPTSVTVNAVGIAGDSVEEVAEVMGMIARALTLPVLDYDAFSGCDGGNGHG